MTKNVLIQIMYYLNYAMAVEMCRNLYIFKVTTCTHLYRNLFKEFARHWETSHTTVKYKKKFELTTKTCYLVKEQEISQFVFSKWSSLFCCFCSLCSLKENFSSNGFREVAQLLIYRQKDNAERLQFLLYYFWDLVLGLSYSSLWRALLLQAISSWC